MTNQRDNQPNRGPFPERKPGEHPWEATETEHGPFERRRDDTGVAEAGETVASGERSPSERRRWGQRASGGGEGLDTLTGRAREFTRRFKEPIIGLAMMGVAAPMVGAGLNPEAGSETEATDETDAAEAAAAVGERDLDEAVGDYWAEAEEDVVRSSTIDGAVTRYAIDQTLSESIYDYAVKHDIEPDIAYGLVFTESTFRERAVSHVGARGLTQLMPRTAQWLEPGVSTRDLFDPDVNLDIGFRYLRQLIDKYEGNLEYALTAYNRGPGTVDRILSRGGNPDNGYAGKVLAG